MTETVATKAAQLARMDAARAGWEALLAEVGEARMEQPGAEGDWTFRDVVAHLNAWRDLTLSRLEAARRGEQPQLPWPAGMSEEIVDGVDGVDEINRWMGERDRDRSVSEVLADSREQFQRLRAAVGALSPEELFEPGRFAWLDGLPLSAVLDGAFEHLEEHQTTTREWLASDQQAMHR